MGVGKTTICKELYKSLDRVAWLDGDWCWMMNPWIVNEETTKMVENNITYLLKNYLTSTAFDYVIFSWVLHREEILNGLLERLNDLEYNLDKITGTRPAQKRKPTIVGGIADAGWNARTNCKNGSC